MNKITQFLILAASFGAISTSADSIDAPQSPVPAAKQVEVPLETRAQLVAQVESESENRGESETDVSDVKSAEEQPLSEEMAAALDMLKQYMGRTKSLTANFSSILLDDTGRQADRSNGTVAFKVPGKFRWQYENPDPSLLMADGVDLWHFDEVLEQVNVSSLSDYRGANPSLLLGGDPDTITEGFRVVGSHVTEGDQWIVLETRDRDSDFVTVRIKFSDNTIALMELIDRVDQTSRIAFSDVDLNPDIEDSFFTFEVPEGASLIGQPSER